MALWLNCASRIMGIVVGWGDSVASKAAEGRVCWNTFSPLTDHRSSEVWPSVVLSWKSGLRLNPGSREHSQGDHRFRVRMIFSNLCVVLENAPGWKCSYKRGLQRPGTYREGSFSFLSFYGAGCSLVVECFPGLCKTLSSSQHSFKKKIKIRDKIGRGSFRFFEF